MTADASFLVQQAAWAGQHALALFFGLLALLWAFICACWWIRGQHGKARRPPGTAPGAGLPIGVGFTLLLLGIGVFTGLASQVGAASPLTRADQALTEALRTHAPTPALHLFATLTHLADTATLTGLCIGIAVALLALGQRGLALDWVVAVAGNGLLNQTLKQIFSRARPVVPDAWVTEHGFSFPSGHSSGALVAYGMLTYLALRLLPARWHLPVLLLAVTLAFTVGASRVFLQVHFASDVIAGFASGGVWLVACLMGIGFIRGRTHPPAPKK